MNNVLESEEERLSKITFEAHINMLLEKIRQTQRIAERIKEMYEETKQGAETR